MTRNWKQALGFYLVYLILTFATGFVLGIFITMIWTQLSTTAAEMPVKYAQVTGEIVGFLFCTTMSILIVRAKKISGVKAYLFVLGSFCLSIVGAFSGLIIPSYLTTRQKET